MQSTKFDKKALTFNAERDIIRVTKNTNVKNGTVKENELCVKYTDIAE